MDTDELHFHVNGTIVKDIVRLKLLYELFAETLDRLHDIGIAAKESPERS